MIIYTANFGDKDVVKEPLIRPDNTKFVYFTDRPFESDVWDVVIDNQQGDSNRIAKWYKINSHEVFPGESTVWIDASIGVLSDPTEFFQGWDNMLVRKHRDRNDIYEEAEACILSDRDPAAVRIQIAEYMQQGHPRNTGLYINSILFRKPTAATTDLNRAWWQEIKRHSFRDQLSLPYALRIQGTLVKEVEYSHFGDCFSGRRRHKFPGSKEI